MSSAPRLLAVSSLVLSVLTALTLGIAIPLMQRQHGRTMRDVPGWFQTVSAVGGAALLVSGALGIAAAIWAVFSWRRIRAAADPHSPAGARAVGAPVGTLLAGIAAGPTGMVVLIGALVITAVAFGAA